MAKFTIEYKDPSAQENKSVVKDFDDTASISAKTWAEDYAYSIADKGYYEITLMED